MYEYGKLSLIADIGKQLREKIELILNDLMDYAEIMTELDSYKLFNGDIDKISNIIKNDPSTLTILNEVDIPLEPVNLIMSPKINPDSTDARTRNIIIGVDSSWIKPDVHIKPLVSVMNVVTFVYAPKVITRGYKIDNIAEVKIGKELFVRRSQQRNSWHIMKEVDLEIWQFELMEKLIEKIIRDLDKDKKVFLLYDGSLSIPYAGNYSTEDQELLVSALRRFIDNMKRLNVTPIGVYHSLSRGFLNALIRGVICVSELSCNRCILEKGDNSPCLKYSIINDKNLFLKRLKVYERGPLFQVHNLVLEHNRNIDIKGFYIKVDEDNIMRVEIPGWASSHIDDIHLSIASQISLLQQVKGKGYPYVLLRAHENAILRTIDKELIYNLIREELKKVSEEKNITLTVKETGKLFYKKHGVL
ncbi:MAG: DNA double-strand break repair nuclease NurA [Thermoprotei archaeon]